MERARRRRVSRGLKVAEEHVGDARALGAGQPGGDHRVRLVQHVAQDHGPAGEKNHHDRNAGGLHVGDGIHVFPGQFQVGAVAIAFGIGRLADDHHAHGGSGGAVAVLGKGDFGLAEAAFLMAASSVVPPGVTSPLLPCQSMVQPPHWLPMIVGVLAGHVDARRGFGQRQRLVLVLQQHQRFAHGLARDGAMLRRAEGLLQAAVGQLRAVLVHQAHGELHAQNAA